MSAGSKINQFSDYLLKMKEIILIGGGGHALSLLESLPEDLIGKGYTALSPSEKMPLPWLGDDGKDEALLHLPAFYHIAFIYGGAPRLEKRRALIERFEKAGVNFATIISSTAIVTPNSKVGNGVAILAGAIVNRAILEDHVVVNTGAIVEHDCRIGKNTFIGPGAVLGGGISVGENCFIGLGARIRNGISIGKDITVGMGSIVTSDLTMPGLYYGSPLKYHPFEQ